jgi:hypothetical protein
MPSRSDTVLAAVLQLLRPLVRLLLRHGVAYPAFSVALKQVFLDAALAELKSTGKKQTDSAVSLLSGVHRRDVRGLTRLNPQPGIAPDSPMNMAAQVVGRWLSDAVFLDDEGEPLPLPRSGARASFDALVEGVSRDVRPRAVLDELVRLGLAREEGERVDLVAAGFAPREGMEEMTALLRDNLHDHAAAATQNLEGDRNFLEQAVFVDQLTAASAEHLHVLSAKAWRQAMKGVMREAQARYDADQATAPPGERRHRVRFGTYFYSTDDNEPTP